MKVIFIISDSFRRDHIGAYGNKWIHTPNLDALAARSCVFEDMFINCFPTGPFRQDVLLGRSRNPGFPFNMWDRLAPEDVTLPARLGEKGIPSQLITDVANCVVGWGRHVVGNYYQGFTAWHVNRGQEGDPWWQDDRVQVESPCPLDMVRYTEGRWRQVLINRAHRKVETDWFAPGTFQLAIDWLERNYTRKDFFLWIDVFDPHEPWDPPQHYTDLYDPGYRGTVYEAPVYGLRKRMGITDRELKQIRARYAGECTMVDTWVGRLLAAVARFGIEEETAVVFTSDHGIYVDGPGDGGIICKTHMVGDDGRQWFREPRQKPTRFFPLRPNLSNTPFMIHMPGQKKGRRVRGFVQSRDICPTILDLFRAKAPASMMGRSLLPMAKGKARSHRNHVLVGYADNQAQVIDRRWLYTSWRGHRACALHDRRADPDITCNVAKKNPQVVARLHRRLIEDMKTAGADDAFLEPFRTD